MSNASHVRHVEQVHFIQVDSVCGAGTEEDLCRTITEFYRQDGKLVTTIDPAEAKRFQDSTDIIDILRAQTRRYEALLCRLIETSDDLVHALQAPARDRRKLFERKKNELAIIHNEIKEGNQ